MMLDLSTVDHALNMSLLDRSGAPLDHGYIYSVVSFVFISSCSLFTILTIFEYFYC
ncbi:hypothetical protein BDV36DRAFT_252111 [Aspergillus pseudocaelatus]|uniref:Uncharacterized protein n=1 Tax=Aspergillus pseudocaelatus TaxID=1825620 RepID=A0ABQ6WQ29_9EURO|nr:hypothetical protein BDV36DRAFT_252111 [Aspergillus pseudocaelatus]